MKAGTGDRGPGAERTRWRASLAAAALLGAMAIGTLWRIAAGQTLGLVPSPVPRPLSPHAQSCPAPRVSDWSAIRDTLWPLIAHHDGDDAWAHLEPANLPRQSATWCNPLQRDAEALAAGRDFYLRLCATCHGDQGRGDGMGAGQQDPRPYDFTRAEFAGMREAPGTAVLYAIMSRGIDGTGMPGFGGDQLSGWERLAVIAYLASLPGREAVDASRAWADTLRARRPAAPR